jgi:hypothetical protein
MICEDVKAALAEGDFCQEGDNGATVVTHCMYPSFDPVHVSIVKIGDGYEISDGGGAMNAAWLHGRPNISKILAKECSRFGIESRNGLAVVRIDNKDWLRSAIIAVANASAAAANLAIDNTSVVAEAELNERIYEKLTLILDKNSVGRDRTYTGISGKEWKYNFIAKSKNRIILINSVTPHHASINPKYVAFSDSPANDSDILRIAVHDRLLSTIETTLMQQVCTLMPILSFESGLRRLVA